MIITTSFTQHESTAIAQVLYFTEIKLMLLQFHNNSAKRYAYKIDQLSTVLAFVDSESKGSFYHKHIKAHSVNDAEIIKYLFDLAHVI